jgi:hypothetical protein
LESANEEASISADFLPFPFISPNVSKVLLASGVAGILLTTATFLTRSGKFTVAGHN